MIREVGPADWQLLRDVRLRALQEAPYAFLTRYEEAAAQPDEHWRERAAAGGDSVTFVVELDGRFEASVSGFVAGDPSTVYLVGMWLAPERRASGEARALVERLVGWARARGAERVRLAVARENHRAARLYERCGFVRLDEQPQLPWDSDSPVYELRL